MEDLVFDGGHIPDAADYEDLGSEIYSMVQRYESMRTVNAWCDELQDEQQSEQLPKQLLWVLYGVLGFAVGGLAVGGLVWLWVKMF